MDRMEQNTLEKFVTELSSLIRARYPLIYLNTYEEPRALELVQKLATQRETVVYIWSRTDGITRGGKTVSDTIDPMAALRWFDDVKEKALFILKDFHPYLKDPGVVRKLRDLSQKLKKSPKNVMLLSPVLNLPPELTKEISVVELPLPAREEIASLIERANSVGGPAGNVDEMINAATGLTYDEIENVLAKSLVSRGKLDKHLVQEEKKQLVKRSGLLEFVDTGGRQTSVGGLEHLKHWLKVRKGGLSAEAREIGLPLPKGILLVGIPGCGKSLTATTVGKEWELPLLRLDLGRIFSGLVGSSEGNIRNALATCDAVAPCILWVDEIEKGLSGTQSSGQSDGGTTSRVFGTLLTWMQEKRSPVFVVATANDISQLPPEFLRKGRFDEIFFVDLPSDDERAEIFKIQMARYGWEAKDLETEALVQRTHGFSGAEIEQCIVSARYLAFGQNEEFSQSHLLGTIDEIVPLSKTMGDRIEGLRSWAAHRARPASVVKGRALPDRFDLSREAVGISPVKKAGEL